MEANEQTRYLLANYQGGIEFEYMPCLNYMMQVASCSALLRCVVVNEEYCAWNDVEVVIDGELMRTSTVKLDCVAKQSEVDITGSLSIDVDPTSLINMTEGVRTIFTLTVIICGRKVLVHDFTISLMAYNQWTGTGIRPELIASFVTPNQPLLSRVNVSAAHFMEQWTGSGALDEYQSQDPNRVRMQVAAIYEALRGEGLVYATPPASFEEYGQRMRMAEQVLTEKLGTCIDLTLLMASCLESIGINPIIILTKGHCFLGVWLVRDSYCKPVGDDVTFLLKSAADGINEIVAVETTCLTSSLPVSFDESVALAMAKLHDEAEFELFVDVCRARVGGVRPLPARVAKDGVWVVENEGVEHEAATTSVRQYDRYDLTAYTSDTHKLTKIQLWERKLLDFSLRNNLLNMRLGKKIIPLLSFDIDRLEDFLQDGKTFHVQPFPLDEHAKADGRGVYNSMQYVQLADYVRQELVANKIHSFLNDVDLKDALKYVYRASRTSIEENGANNLYLVFGLLQWYETDHSQQPHFAPILLLPIEIVRGGGLSGYVIRTRDEEIVLNITLVELLRQQYDVDLSMLDVLPKDDSGVDVKKIFAIIRDRIKDQKGWNVLDESAIGLFSFSKFVMWHDLHGNAEQLIQNPVIASLVDGRLHLDDDAADIDVRQIDQTSRPEDFILPVDVDSSQLEAVIASGAGKSFILHGPPGTGKSQTITNMIANALFQGKRVLFVAEKMAALSVVQSRLEKIGLAPFCLELHSNKVTKQHFLKQMNDALNVTHYKSSNEYKRESDALFAKRQELIRYIEALHSPQESGLSLYDCITAYLSLHCEMMELGDVRLDSITKEALAKVHDLVTGMDVLFKVCGHPADSALSALDITVGASDAEAVFGQSIKAYLEWIQLWQQDLADFPVAVRNMHLDDTRLAVVSGAVEAACAYNRLCQDLSERYTEMVLDLNCDSFESQWSAILQKWFLPRWFAKRAFIKAHRRYNVTCADDVQAILDGLCKIRHYDRKAASIDFVEWPALLTSDMSVWCKLIDDGRQVLDALRSLATVARIIAPEARRPEALQPLMTLWHEHKAEFRNWYLWCEKQRELREMGLGCVVDYIMHNHATAATASEVLMRSLYHALAMRMIDSNEALRFFNGTLFDDTISKYRSLTARFQQLGKQELYAQLASNIPSVTVAASESSEVGILKRNIKNGGRGMSIRKIIDQIPTLLPRLCPCMLMSPISVAQYIALMGNKFDLVIFDEASQMPTSEAVGAIARGNALVVVGDPQQMPPTSFFSASQVDEEEADIDDMESILDDCISLSIPSKHLSWHYRSKHESLIAFSNMQYYDGRLLTFPSVDDQMSKVTLHHIAGAYDKGRTRSNRAEAVAIVTEVLRRLADPQLSRRSMGIVSFSKVQQNLIEDMLCDELAKNPKLEALAFDVAEPVFVKNLENVQGDERDVILFSVGYGPDKSGKVSMNFGPLNNAGGERRLNVAVSRARYEMIVFSTLTAEQIDLRRTQSAGVEGLKKFLEFAEKGKMPVSAQIGQEEASNVIADGIADELRNHGYQVRRDVGRSHFKVDVAVQDPANPDNYLLGILCDGTRYYATTTVRDREVVQPSVLRMLGWNVMRVWTVDWLERPRDVMAAILDCLQSPELVSAAPMPVSEVLPAAEEPHVLESPCREYVFADVTAPFQVPDATQLAAKGRAQLARQLVDIITTEQPITDTLLCKRIVKAWGLSRLTNKIQVLVNTVLNECDVYSQTDNGNSVYWLSPEAADSYAEHRINSERDIQEIPMVEIENAMRYVIDQIIATEADDLKRLAACQLGFTRRGTNIDAATEQALARLVAKGVVRRDGSKVAKV